MFFCFIGEFVFDQFGGYCYYLWDMLGCVWFDIWYCDVDRVYILVIDFGIMCCDCFDWFIGFFGGCDDFVVYIGDVVGIDYFVCVIDMVQGVGENIKNDSGMGIVNMCVIINGWIVDIEGYMFGIDWFKGLFVMVQCVV